jgi:hypothetical protein
MDHFCKHKKQNSWRQLFANDLFLGTPRHMAQESCPGKQTEESKEKEFSEMPANVHEIKFSESKALKE